jgi:hypothetical protein
MRVNDAGYFGVAASVGNLISCNVITNNGGFGISSRNTNHGNLFIDNISTGHTTDLENTAAGDFFSGNVTTSVANVIALRPSIAGVAPSIQPVGETNQELWLQPAGTGGIRFVNGAGSGTIALFSPTQITIGTAAIPVLVPGTTSIGTSTSGAVVILNGPVATGRNINWQTAAGNRWAMGANGTAEAGSNVGSDFALTAKSDAGTTLNTPLVVSRATGQVTLSTGVTVGAGLASWTSGTGAPSATTPVGSMFSRTDGGVGTTLYVSRGGGTWGAVAGV